MACLRPRSLLNASVLTLGVLMNHIFPFPKRSRESALGESKVALLQAVMEMGKRLSAPGEQEERHQIRSAEDVYRLVMLDMAFLAHEQVRVLVLDTKNYVVDNIVLYEGTVASTALRASEVFRIAIVRNAPGIVICHNHPSGIPEPSQGYCQLENRAEQCAKIAT